MLLHLLPFSCALKGQCGDPQFGGFVELGHSWGSEVAPIESPIQLPNTFKYKALLYLPPFGRNSDVKLWLLQLEPPIRVYDVPWGSKVVPIEMSTLHSYATSVHTIYLYAYRAPLSRNTQRVRQTDDRKSNQKHRQAKMRKAPYKLWVKAKGTMQRAQNVKY